MANIYAVRSMATNKGGQSSFEKKADANAYPNELCKGRWAKLAKKAEKDRGPKPFPFTITRGSEHPYWLS